MGETMKDVHITAELLAALHDLEMPSEILLRLGWDHLQALCPECKQGIETWMRPRLGDYDDAFEKAQKAVEEKEEEAAEIKQRIDREVAEILRLDPEKAVEKIKTARIRFRHPRLVDRLLVAAREELHGDPRRAIHLLLCARAIAERSAEPMPLELQLRVRLNYANALRVARRHQDAEAAFVGARQMIRENPTVAYGLYALAARFEGSLRKDQGRFKEAKKLLSQAILIYRVFGEEREAAKALLKLAYVHYRLDQPEESFAVIHQALEILAPEEDLALVVGARQVLASYLCDTGDAESARRVVDNSRHLFDTYIDQVQAETFRLLVLWLEGRIARNLGEYERAEEHLVDAAEGFSDLDIGYDMALVLLDLADSYLAAGDGEAVRQLVPQIEPLLSANDLDQEIIAALLLFQHSINQELVSSATVAMIREKILRVGRLPRWQDVSN